MFGKGKGKSKRKRVGESSATQFPPPPGINDHGIIAPDEQFWPIYASLIKRPIRSTRFFCPQTLRKLGILDEVTRLAQNFGWGDFIHLHAHTYERVTLEFLASLRKEVFEPEDVDEDPQLMIHFRMFNEDHSLTESDLNEIFFWHATGLDHPSEMTSSHRIPYNEQEWWRSITNKDRFQTNTSKVNNIIHLALRYFVRLLQYAVFFKANLGSMVKDEVACLFLADNPQRLKFQCSSTFIQRLLDTRDNRLGDEIFMGGMITIIALSLKNGAYKDQIELLPPVHQTREELTDEFPPYALSISALRHSRFLNYTNSKRRFILLVDR